MDSQPNIPSEALDHELEELLQEAESMVAQLRTELNRRRSQQREMDLAEQHAEIARLSQHLADAQVRWADVRGFLQEMITELRKEKQ